MLRPTRALLALVATLSMVAGCSLDRAELYEAGGRIESEVDDLSVLTYRDDPATDDWVDLVVPDAGVFEEGDPFREEDSRAADDDQAADQRRLFTRTATGRSVLVQLNRTTGELQLWEFVDADDEADGAILSSGAAVPDATNDVESGDHLTVVRDADAGEAEVVVEGDDDVSLEKIASASPGDGVDVYVDVYLVTGEGRATLTYEDATGTTVYDVVATA